jgi:hypothetical protein
MQEEVRKVEVKGEEVTNLYRDLKPVAKKDIFEEIFEDASDFTGSPSYGTGDLNKKGWLEIAKQTGVIESYEEEDLSARHRVEYSDDERLHVAPNKEDLVRMVEEEIGYKLSINSLSKDEAFEILYFINEEM